MSSNISLIHPTAIVDPSAHIHESVTIGAYSLIGKNVHIGAHTVIHSHCVIDDRSIIGSDCYISPGVVIGTPPQDVNYDGFPTHVVIGNNTTIREYVTINRSTGENTTTNIGNNCMIMTGCHVAHNCQIGHDVILANNTVLAGYVEIGDYAFLSGVIVVHQFVKIGRFAIISGLSGTRVDIPPFAIADGRPASIAGINAIGLKRKGIDSSTRSLIRKAYQYIWFSDLNRSQGIAKVKEELPENDYLVELIQFIENSKRGVPDKRCKELEN